MTEPLRFLVERPAPRLDRFLAEVHPAVSRSRWKQLIEDGRVTIAGAVQAAPAPRFSRTGCQVSRPPAHAGQHTEEALLDWGLSSAELEGLREKKAIA